SPQEKRDKLELLANIFRSLVKDIRSVDDAIELGDDYLVIRSYKCGFMDLQKEKGIDLKHVNCCLADEIVWHEYTNQIHPRIVNKVTKSLARGDDHCEYLFKFV
ncbi:hypothetical protein ACFLWX_03890, partial [Chloroflexota bacterium]